MTLRPLVWLAERLIRGPNREYVLGDLEDGYAAVRARRGSMTAVTWFVVMTLRSRHSLRRRTSGSGSRTAWLADLGGDLRAGLRLLRSNPGVAATTAVVMTLGIGVATLAFAVHRNLYRGLPVTDPDRMVLLTATVPTEGDLWTGVSFDDYVDLRARQTTLDDFALWDAHEPANFAAGGAPPERVRVTYATANLHRLLELTPLLGRLLTADDVVEGAPRVAVLSAPFWERRFGADSSVVGRAVRINGEPVTIVGVLPPGAGFENEDLFLPVRAGAPSAVRRGSRPYYGLGRLRTPVSAEDATEELALLAAGLAAAFPVTNRGVSARVVPFAEWRAGVGGSRLLRITAALILIIAVANVSNLFLVRAIGRTRELRLRMALGAGRWRVVRHFVAEAVGPIGIGGALGAAFAAYAVPWVMGAGWESGHELPNVLFAFGLTAAVIVITGGIAASRTLRRAGSLALSDGSRGNTSASVGRIGSGLVVIEIALGGAALFVAGLMIKTAVNLERVDYGFAIDDVMTGTVQLDEGRYDTPEKRGAFWDTFQTRVAALPGVEWVTLATQLPMIRYRGWTDLQLDESSGPEPTYLGANHSAVTPDFFDTFAKTLLQGRAFTDADGPSSEPVAIVNEDFVRKFTPDGNALGRRIKLGGRGSTEPWRRVVGIAPHMWMDTDVVQHPEGVYVPLAQVAPTYASVAVRVGGRPEDYRDELRETLMGLDGELPLVDARSMATLIHDRTSLYRRVGPQYTFFGAAALVLSMVGLYGVMAYTARSRTREMGIRMALGARHIAIVRLVLRHGLAQISIGVAFGVAIALYASKGISRLVFQMSPWDPWVLGSSFGLLALTGVVATLVPARRAARVDPLVVLQSAD